MAKSGGVSSVRFNTSPARQERAIRAPRVPRQDRIFPIPATKEVKAAKVDDMPAPKAPKLDVGKPMKPAKMTMPKPFKAKLDGKPFK